jgi:hypothetical protein
MAKTSSNSSEAYHLGYYEHEADDLSYYKREVDEINWWCKVRERDEYLRVLNEAGRTEYDCLCRPDRRRWQRGRVGGQPW